MSRSKSHIIASFLMLGTVATSFAMTVDLSAEATVSVPNDTFRAEAFAEATAASPQEAAALVNPLITAGLKSIPRSMFKVKTAGLVTTPSYTKAKITGWRARSSFILETQDAVQFADQLTKLQGSLGISGVQLTLSAGARRAAEEAATAQAVAHFKAKADALATGSFGKPYRIKSLTVSSSGGVRPQPFLARNAMLMESAPVSIEAGDSDVIVQVSGQIEIDN